MIKKTICSLATALSLFFAKPAEADESNYIDNSIENRAVVAAANTGFGALVGCIGAEISGDGCLEGAWRGSIGGAISFAGMQIGSYNSEVPFTGLVGRGINDLGSSIVSNAAFSRGFLDRYETTLGPVLFSFDKNEGTRLYLQPISVGVIAYHTISGNRLDVLSSFEDGTFVFMLDNPFESFKGGGVSGGQTGSNIPAYIEGFERLRSHENIHTYQISRFRWVDELVPEIWKFRYGAEMAAIVPQLPNTLGGDVYRYSPVELEAFAMEYGGIRPY